MSLYLSLEDVMHMQWDSPQRRLSLQAGMISFTHAGAFTFCSYTTENTAADAINVINIDGMSSGAVLINTQREYPVGTCGAYDCVFAGGYGSICVLRC